MIPLGLMIATAWLAGPASRPAPVLAPLVQDAGTRMVRDLDLRFSHDLGAAEAKRRLQARIETVRRMFAGKVSSDVKWTDDSADIRATALSQTARAHIAITDTTIDVKVHLPLLLAPFGERLQAFVNKNVGALL